MIVVDDLLSANELRAVRDGLSAAPFRDGAATAGDAAARVKHNQQARPDDPGVTALGRRVRLALEAHDVVRRLIRPVLWSNLIFSRYRPGQQYGLHADNAAMHDTQGWPLRTDVSFTLFLSDPETYEGGALMLRDLSGDRAVSAPTRYVCAPPANAESTTAVPGWPCCRRAPTRG